MTTWTYGGTALTTFGKVTLINEYLDIPERRGDNILVPFRHGAVFAPKYYGERKITFGIISQAATATAMESTMDTMRTLFAPQTQQTLSMTREDSTVRTAQATVDRPLNFERLSATLSRVVVEFALNIPFFRLSTVIGDNTTTINASPKAMVVTNPGTIEERDAIITLTGPLQNTVITNSTNGNTLTYTGTIASPRVVTIQTASSGEYTATTDLGANVIGNVTHSGAAALMVFNVGTNNLSITDATATTGTVKASFYAPFL